MTILIKCIKLHFMRNKLVYLIIPVFIFTLLYCSKDVKNKDALSQQVSSNANIENIPVLNFTPSTNSKVQSQAPSGGAVATLAAACGGLLSRNVSSSGYYTYPLDTINATSVVEGTTISVALDGIATPNRFSIIDPQTGTTLASSPWLGVALYSGPWGTSLNQRGGTLTFTKRSGVFYHLKVEAQGNGSLPYTDNWTANVSCATLSSTIKVYGGVSISYYSSTGMLKFNSAADIATVLDKLESDYETYNTNYENQFPTYTADQLDVQDSISNFNQWQPVEAFEALFTGFLSKRKDLDNKENTWLNTYTDITDANNPDSLDYSSDYAANAVANVSNKFIVGTETYEFKQHNLFKNGEPWEDDAVGEPAFASTSTSGASIAAISFCSYCALCRNWEREGKMSLPWTATDGRVWKFKKVIAIRGISGDARGHVKATIKCFRKVGSKYKKKRAYVSLQMQGSVFSNKCTQQRAFNSGVYSSSRPRSFYRKRYAAVADRFFRTKKTLVWGTYTADPKGNGTPFGETLVLSW